MMLNQFAKSSNCEVQNICVSRKPENVVRVLLLSPDIWPASVVSTHTFCPASHNTNTALLAVLYTSSGPG